MKSKFIYSIKIYLVFTINLRTKTGNTRNHPRLSYITLDQTTLP